MKRFQLQVRSISHNIWYTPGDFRQAPALRESDSVEELRGSIRSAADSRTLSFSQHVRIITNNGDPVERWTILPGSAKKLRRKW